MESHVPVPGGVAPPGPRLRVLAVAPEDPGGPLLDGAGECALAAYARAAAGRVAYTVLADEAAAAGLRELPAGCDLVVAPPWRVVPRARADALRAPLRLQAALAGLAELLATARLGRSATPWDCVHGFGVAGAPAAAAVARALGVPWLWSPPAWAPDPAAAGPAAAPDEAAVWWAEWAADTADLVVAEDLPQLAAIRRAWAPDPARLALLPHGALAGWPEPAPGSAREPAPATARETGPKPAPDPVRVALLAGRGATDAEATAALAVLARLRDEGGCPGGLAVCGAGLRHGPAALAVRRETRRRGLLAGLRWRDLEPGAPLADLAGALGRPDAAVVLGGESPPRRLLAELARAGVAVVSGAAGAARLAPLLADRAATARACRAAWRASVAPQAAGEAELGRQLARAVARVVRPAARAAAATGAA